jgi:hypothetical protein
VCALVGRKLVGDVAPSSCMQEGRCDSLGVAASCVFVRIVHTARACRSSGRVVGCVLLRSARL